MNEVIEDECPGIARLCGPVLLHHDRVRVIDALELCISRRISSVESCFQYKPFALRQGNKSLGGWIRIGDGLIDINVNVVWKGAGLRCLHVMR